MEELKERVLQEGRAISEDILKVDSFLNHQLDPELMMEIGKEFARRFKDIDPTCILTIEASGIAVAVMTGFEMGLPVVFAKKRQPGTMNGGLYQAEVKSFTKNREYDICVSADYLSDRDRVLIIDDFLARGNAITGLMDIVKQSGACLEGVGIVIEKGFQQGGKKLREKGIRLESLAIVSNMKNGVIMFD